jgi:hypothetical protein
LGNDKRHRHHRHDRHEMGLWCARGSCAFYHRRLQFVSLLMMDCFSTSWLKCPPLIETSSLKVPDSTILARSRTTILSERKKKNHNEIRVLQSFVGPAHVCFQHFCRSHKNQKKLSKNLKQRFLALLYIKQAGAPTVPSSDIECQSGYWPCHLCHSLSFM